MKRLPLAWMASAAPSANAQTRAERTPGDRSKVRRINSPKIGMYQRASSLAANSGSRAALASRSTHRCRGRWKLRSAKNHPMSAPRAMWKETNRENVPGSNIGKRKNPHMPLVCSVSAPHGRPCAKKVWASGVKERSVGRAAALWNFQGKLHRIAQPIIAR